MNFHRFHGVYPNRTSGVVERKMALPPKRNRKSGAPASGTA
jgi:hypothetical protein